MDALGNKGHTYTLGHKIEKRDTAPQVSGGSQRQQGMHIPDSLLGVGVWKTGRIVLRAAFKSWGTLRLISRAGVGLSELAMPHSTETVHGPEQISDSG